MPNKLQLDHIIFVLKGVLIGLIVGLIVSTFRWAIEKLLNLTTQLYRLSHQSFIVLGLIFIINIVIGLIVGWFIYQQPHISGSGIPEVEGQLNNQLQTSWWKILCYKFWGGILTLGAGLVLGREGPSIQLGAAVGQGWGKIFEKKDSNQKITLAAGAAGGLAAAFNAPLASTFFILEEIYHNFSPLIWMSALASSLSADFVSMKLFGLTPVLHLGQIPNFPLNNYWILFIISIILGVCGYFYQLILLKMPQIYHRIFPWLPRAFQGIVALILIIPLGFWQPHLLGGGNNLILNLNAVKNLPIITLVLIFCLRFIVSMIDYGSGLPGGIFLPILSLGALLSFILALVFIRLQLLSPKYLVNFIVFGMVAFFACIGKAPFTAILLITEMVGSLNHLMPLALAALIAYMTVDLLGGDPIYDSLLRKMLKENQPDHFSDNNQIFQLTIFNNNPLVDHQIKEIYWTEPSLVLKIKRGEHEITPHGSTTIRVGDILVLTTTIQEYQRLKEKNVFFTSSHT